MAAMVCSMAAMLHPDADLTTLEASVACAGAALACAYSSSAEFDAALIAERRAAGLYGPRRRWRQALVAAAAIGGALALIVCLVG